MHSMVVHCSMEFNRKLDDADVCENVCVYVFEDPWFRKKRYCTNCGVVLDMIPIELIKPSILYLSHLFRIN